MRLIDCDALKKDWSMADRCEDCPQKVIACQYDQDFTRMDICQMLDDAPTVGGWISIEDRLPDDARRVLCCTKTQKGNYNIVIGYYMGGLWRCGMNSNVVYWMELPRVPE